MSKCPSNSSLAAGRDARTREGTPGAPEVGSNPTASTALLACPFCGKAPRLKAGKVKCVNNQCKVQPKTSAWYVPGYEQNAVADWNERRQANDQAEPLPPAVELEEIKSVLATVLPGPWRYDHDGGVIWASEAVKPTPDSNALSRVCDATGRWALHDPTHEAQILANLNFIARCREWIPALVSEVEKLRRHGMIL